MQGISESYSANIRNRSTFRFILGALARVKRHIMFYHARSVARKRGATIGVGTCFFKNFARQLGPNVQIGSHTSINTCNLQSNRYKVQIGDYVIIGNDTEIVIDGHDIDSPYWENVRKSDGLIIEDYVWICPHSIILPSCKRIGRGAVIGAGSVVVKDVEPMSVVSGNPAKELRKRKTVHSEISVESLLGGDFVPYIASKYPKIVSK